MPFDVENSSCGLQLTDAKIRLTTSLNVQRHSSVQSKTTELTNKTYIKTKEFMKPKARVKAPTPLQRIYAEKRFVKNHYFSAGIKINDETEKDVCKEPSPFDYPKDLEEFSYKVMSKAWRDSLRRKELKDKYNDRNSYKTRQQLDILNRLYVKEPAIQSMTTILDIDPNFFSIIEGRPIIENFRARKYLQDVRKVLRTRIVTGFREDEIALIEQNFNEEQKLINEVKESYQNYVNTFEAFLYYDHTASMTILRQSEKEAAVASEKHEIYTKLSKEFGALKYAVYNLEEQWRSCKMYQKFLYLISPVYWRRKHDYYHLTEKQSHQSLVSEMSGVFGKYKLASSGDMLSLEHLIQQFVDDCKTQLEPLLFFQTPGQLLKVFRFIEIQNLNTLLHIEELAIPTENVKEGIRSARLVFDAEIQSLQEVVDSLEGGIVWEEQRAESLEQLTNELIKGDFKKLISEEEVLNLYVFVEDVYEARVAPNDANIGLADMMKSVEIKYRNYVLQLDTLPQDQVQRAESECFAHFAKTMRIAQEAAKRVVQIERLTHRLKRALEPPFQRNAKELKWRSAPAKVVVPPPLPPRPLTSKEMEHLTYFTEYCKKIDSLRDFGIFIAESKGHEGEDENKIKYLASSVLTGK